MNIDKYLDEFFSENGVSIKPSHRIWMIIDFKDIHLDFTFMRNIRIFTKIRKF
jgi:hypothetical protein